MVAARLAKLKHGDNQHTKEDRPNGLTTISQSDAAKMLNVGERTVKRAKVITDGYAAGTVSESLGWSTMLRAAAAGRRLAHSCIVGDASFGGKAG